jgi:hypothetical protein
MFGEQISQQRRPSAGQQHQGVEVRRIHLPDQLATATARRQHIERRLLVPPDRHYRGYAIFARRDHGGDGAVLGTEPGPARGVDADTAEAMASVGDQNRGNVSEQAIPYTVRSQRRLGGIYQLCAELDIHETTISDAQAPAARHLASCDPTIRSAPSGPVLVA